MALLEAAMVLLLGDMVVVRADLAARPMLVVAAALVVDISSSSSL